MKLWVVMLQIQKGSMDFEAILSIHKTNEGAIESLDYEQYRNPEESYFIVEEWLHE